jgi:HEAT repeats
MKWWYYAGMVLTVGLALEGGPSLGQVVEKERDVTITGPRGKSIQRSTVTERGHGMVDRQVTVQRPGGTFHSNTLVERAPGFGRPGPGPRGGFGPPFRFGPAFGPREVIVNNGGGPGSWLAPVAIVGGLFGLGALAGSALSSQPAQPVYAVPPPVVVAPQPNVIYNAPQPYGGQPVQGPTVVVDPVADAAARLQSHHANSRIEGAYTLGRLRDPRAIPPLIDRLKNDNDADVRIASATALGEIGDPQVATYLERVTIYDKKQKVRDAAAVALSRLPRAMPQPAGQPVMSAPAGTPYPSNVAPAPSIPATSAPTLEPEPVERVPPPPTPAAFPDRS